MAHLLNKHRFTEWPSRLILLSTAVLSLGVIGCESESRSTAKAPGSSSASARSSTAARPDPGPPPWVAASRRWSDTLRWVLNGEGEIVQDSLLFRLSGSAIQSFVGGPKAKAHPIMCWFEMTVRPVPQWSLAKGLVLDSVVFHDPVRHVHLPALPMLSSERLLEGGTLRTRFTNNLAKPYTPDLTDGQMLEPIAYFTWDRRTIIVAARPIPLAFVTELRTPPGFADSLQRWGPM